MNGQEQPLPEPNDDQPGNIPSVESPEESGAGQESQNVETSFLGQQAKSAAFRDVVGRDLFDKAQKERICVLQTKLDQREAEIAILRPENSALNRSKNISKVLVRDGTVIMVVAGMIVSFASLIDETYLRHTAAGCGFGFLIIGMWICKILNKNVWDGD